MKNLIGLTIALFALVFTATGCELESEEDEGCDPSADSRCLCTDDIVGVECVKGGANCTCAIPSAQTNNMANNMASNATTNNASTPAEVEVVPSPTSVTMAQNNEGEADVAWLCMTDPFRDDPRVGLTLGTGRCDNSLVVYFRVDNSDQSTLYIGSTGTYALSSYSSGEFGEGWAPGTEALSLSTDATTDLVVNTDDQFREKQYQVAFTVVSSDDDQGRTSIQIETATATLLP